MSDMELWMAAPLTLLAIVLIGALVVILGINVATHRPTPSARDLDPEAFEPDHAD